MNQLVKVLGFLQIIIITAGCLYEKGSTLDPTAATVITPPRSEVGNTNPNSLDSLPCDKATTTNAQNQVCFNTVILPILLANCATSGCHDAKTAAEGYDLTSYQKIMRKGITAGNSNNSKLYKMIIDTGRDRMPPAPNIPMSSDKIKLIAQWIDDGAKNITCETISTGIISTQTVSYSKHITLILDYYCTGCHNSTTKSGGISLATYADVKTMAIDGGLYGSISHQIGFKPMPGSDVKLSDCQIVLVKQWIDSGMPNN
ncbi:c-type cytochrome domain-containing protein [Runella sp.]|uniref:c-type cytochrome domain-containing protein n=1 Tax=Runella sp. TaxID=1960881 RepID=UPI003D0AF928